MDKPFSTYCSQTEGWADFDTKDAAIDYAREYSEDGEYTVYVFQLLNIFGGDDV